MTPEQLQAARAAHWRQKQSPLLTLDDAGSWLAQHPLCLYLPRQAQLPAPAPSFVEACMGVRQTTPPPAAIAQAQELLTRLIAAGNVVPLNLLGAVGEQPDYLAHRDALPYVLSLRADPDWKHAPQKSSGHKVSPLVLELWKVLEKEGILSAAEARETLGRELTEAAVLRALCELWQGLRISPVYAEPATCWEMLRVRHREALNTAGGTGQVTALSLLVSMYLQSVYAATSEEIEIFLSPVASRSRVREAVRGLSATRQIHALSMDAQTYHFLENGLPEFAELAVPPAVEAPAVNPAAPPARSAPIFRRPKPATPPAARAATPPAPRSPHPAAQSRPPWRSAAKPQERGRSAPWKSKEGGTRPPARGFVPPDGRGAERFVPGARPKPEAVSGKPPYGRPAATRPSGGPRSSTRTGPQTGERNRPSAKPWAGPGRSSSSAFRPPRADGRGDSRPPFSGPENHAASGPKKYAASGPRKYPSSGPRKYPASGQQKYPAKFPPGKNLSSRPSRRAAEPERSGVEGSAVYRGRPQNSSRSGNAGRPPSRPPNRPQGPPTPGTGDSAPRPARPSGRPSFSSRPKDGRPGAGPPKPWRRAGGPTGKPGKPPSSFRGRKPNRKKPGA